MGTRPGRIPDASRALPGLAVRMVTVAALIGTACGCTGDPDPPSACAEPWAEASWLREGIESASASEAPVWGDYRLADGAYLIHAGDTEDGRACVGLVRRGGVVAYGILDEQPTLSTPLYGYHFPWTGNGGPFDGLVRSSAQPPAVRDWLDGHGASSAVVVPLDIGDFPFEIPHSMRVQVVVHEAFHVHVQSPRWLGTDGFWPNWDLQPDRPAVRDCYGRDSTVAIAFESERAALDSLVVSLLDGDRPAACRAASTFGERREYRYDLLGDMTVPDHEGEPLSCRDAEALMELEEGTADFASWSRMYHDGFFSRDDLLRRYRAAQAETFYLTGAMQLHAVHLTGPGRLADAALRIVDSRGPEDGSITRALERAMGSYCE